MRGAARDSSWRRSGTGIARGIGGPALCLAAAMLPSLGCRPGAREAATAPAPASPAAAPLPKPGERLPVKSGETLIAELPLEAGHFFHARVEQRGIDLTVELKSPSGETITKIDSLNGAWGPEEVILLVPATGAYRLEVHAGGKAGQAGEVEWEVVASREPTARDRQLVAAEAAFRRGLGERRAGKPLQAIESLREAWEGFTELGLRRRQGDVLQGLYRAHDEAGNSEIAATFAEQAAELSEGEGDLRLAAGLARSGGHLRLQLGQPRQAIAILAKAQGLYQALRDARGEALSLGLLGSAHGAIGQLQRGQTLFEEAFEVLKAQPDESTEAILSSDYGSLLLDLNRPREGAASFARAAEIDRRQGRAELLPIALRGLAEAKARAGEAAAAEEAIAEALEMERGQPKGRALAVALHSAGRIRHLAGNLSAAEQTLREALSQAREAKDARTEAFALLDLGLVRLHQGEATEALALEEEARALFEASGDRKGEASALVRGAEALRDLGRPFDAWQRLEPALEVIEELRQTTVRRDFRSSYFASRQDYFDIALEILLRCHEQKPNAGYQRTAWELHERRLARELEAARWRGMAEAAPEVRTSERDLGRKLGEAALLADAAERDERVSGLLAELYRLRSATEKESADRLPQPARQRSKGLLAAVQHELARPQTTLLAFALGEVRSYLWAITAAEVEVRFLPPRRELEALARDFVARLRNQRRSSQEGAARLGVELSRLLLGPVAPRLGAERLLLVADGALQELPWAALPLPGAEGEGRQLLEAHELSSLPSARVLLDLRRNPERRRRSERALAIFADPVLSSEDPRLSSSVRSLASAAAAGSFNTNDRELERSATGLGADLDARLPETQAEAASILELAPPGPHWLATGFAASRDALLTAPLEGFGVLHLATHALLDRDEPELSGIVLSRFDSEGRAIAGFVRAFEVSRLRLPGCLVVLSSCESGIGKDLKGEGMQSLLRAFFEAGADGVIASLWPVSDRRTAILMRHFYRGLLQRGLPAPEALRQAQLALKKDSDSADPYYWAGFYYQGDRRGW